MHLEEELVGLLEGEIVRDLVAGALACTARRYASPVRVLPR
jgi:hypothetical protein